MCDLRGFCLVVEENRQPEPEETAEKADEGNRRKKWYSCWNILKHFEAFKRDLNSINHL
jgi:hypothetical protein